MYRLRIICKKKTILQLHLVDVFACSQKVSFLEFFRNGRMSMELIENVSAVLGHAMLES